MQKTDLDHFIDGFESCIFTPCKLSLRIGQNDA